LRTPPIRRTGLVRLWSGAWVERWTNPASFVRYPLSKKVMASLKVFSVHAVPTVLNDTKALDSMEKQEKECDRLRRTGP
jgi:hypothetical protein